MKIKVEYYGEDADKYLDLWNSSVFFVNNSLRTYSNMELKPDTQVVFLQLSENLSQQIFMIHKTIRLIGDKNILLVILGNRKYLRDFIKFGVSEAFDKDSPLSQIEKRVSFMVKNPFIPRKYIIKGIDTSFKIPLWKRFFDILFAGFTLVLLFPVLFAIGVFIRIESKGPVLYTLKSVGIGFKVFDLYQFRSFCRRDDKAITKSVEKSKTVVEKKNDRTLKENFPFPNSEKYYDRTVREDKLIHKKEEKELSSSIRIDKSEFTKMGRFIRNTNIVGYPQLFNVLKGDMSVVGNRPIPLSEAEKLKSDMWMKHFAAPPGITGLWNISKGEKSTDSNLEKDYKKDFKYGQKYNFWSDLEIIIRSIPGIFNYRNIKDEEC